MRQEEHYFEYLLYIILMYTIFWLSYYFFFSNIFSWYVAFLIFFIIDAEIDTYFSLYTDNMYWTVADIVETYYKKRTVVKTDVDVRKRISDAGYENSIVYDNPSFDGAIIGIDVNGKTVYEYSLMADEYVKSEFPNIECGDSEEYYDAIAQAYEWIDYNTIRATPYMGALAPVVISFNPEEEKWINLINLEDYNIDDIEYDIQKDILKDLEN